MTEEPDHGAYVPEREPEYQPQPEPQRTGPWRILRRVLKWGFGVVAILFILVILQTCLYSVVAPPVSALMVWRLPDGNGITKHWVPLEAMSSALPAAVIASEDARFCSHHGVDWEAVQTAFEEAGDDPGSGPRGASTISMQLVKNLFLWPSRSYVRKGLEVPLAYFADFVMSKRRIIEIYLNVVEWGPGIYGAEAAARHHFDRGADELTALQAALLAASLPDPDDRTAGRPGPVTRRIANRVARRMGGIEQHIGCLDGG